jgi:DNA-binding winged helix-turn-helix (wHTH) protein
MRLRFEQLVLDPDARQVFRGPRELRLGPRSFDLLELLVRSRPRALRKAEIQRRLWPDAAVGDGSLAFLVSELRALLGDDARRPRFIRTVPAFGYAFCGEVTEEEAPADAAPTACRGSSGRTGSSRSRRGRASSAATRARGCGST